MPDTESFVPRWASAPGETILQLAVRQNRDLAALASELGLDEADFLALTTGTRSISLDLAERLSQVLGSSQRFWLTRDAQYQDDRARVTTDKWASALPLSDMHRWGWVPKAQSWQDRIEISLDFFGVEDYEEWSDSYRRMLVAARYRASSAHEISEPATAAWIRQAERLSMLSTSAHWDKAAFKESLPTVKELTREPDPRRFIPELRRLSAACGVALVVLQAPKGCRASGASVALPDGRPLMVLSARYLADDHFWFTYFHEAAHLLFHDLKRASVDEFEPVATVPMDNDERYADWFASDILVARDMQSELKAIRNRPRDIVRFARQAGTSPGVIVGQLQRLGILQYREGNTLKRRYRWIQTTLEMA